MGTIGRPRMKNRLPNTPYNISVDTHDRLDKLKKKGETQDGVVKRILMENELVISLKTDLIDMNSLREDALRTVRELRESRALLEIKLNDLRRFKEIIRKMTGSECIMLRWIY